MVGSWICIGMQLWKGFEYSRIPSIPGFCICKRSEGTEQICIWQNNALWQGSEYAWSTFHRVLRFYICHGLEYDMVVNMRGLHRMLNMSKYVLIMSQYAWICLNNAEYDWICRYIPQKQCWICQNCSECAWCRTQHKTTVQVTGQLPGQRRIQNTVKHLRWNALQKEKYLNGRAQAELFQGMSGCCGTSALRFNPMVYLELASFGKTEVLDLDRVFAKKGYVLVDFNSMCSSYFTQCSRIKFLFFFSQL